MNSKIQSGQRTRSTVLLSALTVCLSLMSGSAFAIPWIPQETAAKKNDNEFAVVRGQISHAGEVSKANVSFDEIKAVMNQRVMPPPVPFPAQWQAMNAEDRKQWVEVFQNSDEGKRFVQQRDKMLKEAKSFEVIFDEDGEFAVYDVPPGTFGLQGRIDKEIDGIMHAFEVFAKIEVEADVQVVQLKPIPIVTTPLYKRGQAAPAISVKSIDGEKTINFDVPEFDGKYVFLNFWFSGDPDRNYQKQIQKMAADLKDSHSLALLSISIDTDRERALAAIKEGEFTGVNGIAGGWEHPIIDAYAVRSTPSGWLLTPDRKIHMTQHEFYQALRVKQSMTDVIRDRIDGKDKPTLAERSDKGSEPKAADDKTSSSESDVGSKSSGGDEGSK